MIDIREKARKTDSTNNQEHTNKGGPPSNIPGHLKVTDSIIKSPKTDDKAIPKQYSNTNTVSTVPEETDVANNEENNNMSYMEYMEMENQYNNINHMYISCYLCVNKFINESFNVSYTYVIIIVHVHAIHLDRLKQFDMHCTNCTCTIYCT